MYKEEASQYLPQLVGKEIKKVCYCEPRTQYGQSGSLYLEFDDGSHFEIYADAALRFTGMIKFNPQIGSIAENKINMAKTTPLATAMASTDGFWFEPGVLR